MRKKMKALTIVVVLLALLVIALFFTLGFVSKSGAASGLVQGRLLRCPDKPNCICSEFEQDVSHWIEPLVYTGSDVTQTLDTLKQTIREMGGRIQAEDGIYVAAIFTTPVFGFVDDLEIRIDAGEKLIHLRSSSRVGYSDRGVKRKRVERLKRLFRI